MSNKRPYPNDDTLCIYIPLSITANLIEILRSYKRQKQISKKARLATTNKTVSDSTATTAKEKQHVSNKDQDQSNVDDTSLEISDGCKDRESDDKGSAENIIEDIGASEDVSSKGDAIRRGDFSSFTDYIEAKYVRGLTVTSSARSKHNNDADDAMEIDGADADADEYDDDEGSYYSDADNNFLDDSELVTSVAEQVYASVAKTKVEVDRADSDDSDEDNLGFFVNAGDIEMVENDHDESWFADAHEEYEAEKQRLFEAKQKKVKPKKKATTVSASVSNAGSAKKASTPTPKVETEDRPKSIKSDKEIKMLRKKADNILNDLRRLEDAALVAIKDIPEENLPRKPTTFKTPMVIPEDKKPGDRVKFENPRVPGQTLQVVVPKSSQPGSEVMVTCPLPKGEYGEYDPMTTSNRIPKRVRELIDVYGRVHDEWVVVEAQYRDSVPSEEPLKPHLERMKKFDKILDMFPKNLIVPMDGKYLKDKIKQLRQNRQKRNKWLMENNREDEVEELRKEDYFQADSDTSYHDRMEASNAEIKNDKTKGDVVKTKQVGIPQLKYYFPKTIHFNLSDFVRKSS